MSSDCPSQVQRILLFNLATDLDDPFLAFTTHWICELAKRIAFIDVVTMRAGRIEVPENVRVYSVGKEKGYSEFRRAVEFYSIIVRLVASNRYDGCFAHMMPLFAVMAAPVLRLRKVPIVLWYAHKSVTPMLRFAERLVDRVVTSTKEGFRLQSTKVRIIGQGIETERFIPLKKNSSPEGSYTLLTVGRLSPIKKLELLIDAIRIFEEEAPDVNIHVNIVGGPLTEADDAYAKELRKQVEHANLQSSITFVGSVHFADIVEHYQQSDFFVNLCPTGAIDKVVLEAMSCGVLPLVSNRSFLEVFDPELRDICVIEPDARELAERLQSACMLSEKQRELFGKRLRATVVREHALHGLCREIVSEFGETRSTSKENTSFAA